MCVCLGGRFGGPWRPGTQRHAEGWAHTVSGGTGGFTQGERWGKGLEPDRFVETVHSLHRCSSINPVIDKVIDKRRTNSGVLCVSGNPYSSGEEVQFPWDGAGERGSHSQITGAKIKSLTDTPAPVWVATHKATWSRPVLFKNQNTTASVLKWMNSDK